MQFLNRAFLILVSGLVLSGPLCAQDAPQKQEDKSQVSTNYDEIKGRTTVVGPEVKLTEELSFLALYSFDGKGAHRPDTVDLVLRRVGTDQRLRGVDMVYFRFGEHRLKMPAIYNVKDNMGIKIEFLFMSIPTGAFVDMVNQVAKEEKLQFQFSDENNDSIKGEVSSSQLAPFQKVVESFPAVVSPSTQDHRNNFLIDAMSLEQLRSLSALIQERIKKLEAESRPVKKVAVKK